MKNIVLIGMMGCGKSTCGRLLARELNRSFVDADALIESREGRTISQMFAEEGEEYFRRKETEISKELGAGADQVIATGGGLPLRKENMDALRENGIVIWIDRDPGETFSNESLDGRPLAQAGQADFIARYLERAPIYRTVSDYVVRSQITPMRTVSLILKEIQGELAQ